MGASLERLDALYKPDTFDDTLNAATITALEGAATTFGDFQEGYLSQLKRIIHGDDAGNWHDDIENVFSRDASLKNLASKTPLDEKLILHWKFNLNDLSAVPTDAQHIVLDASAEMPTDNIAIVSTTQEAVAAQLAGAVGTAALTEVTGVNALEPENLVAIFDGDTHDAILSGSRRVWGLLQVGSAATDGNAFAVSGNDQGQISFVRLNSTGDDLELVPVGDMDAAVIKYAYTLRTNLDDSAAGVFRGDIADIDPPASAVVSLDNAYNGGTYIEADGSDVEVRLADTVDFDVKKSGGASLLTVARNDGGNDTVTLDGAVDIFDVNAAASDFANGVTIDTASQTINVGVTGDGILDSATIEARATTGDATIQAASGDINLVTTRQASLPLDDATAGAISALTGGPHASVSAAIAHAMTIGGVDLELKLFVAGTNYARDENVPAATFDLTTHSIDMNTISGVNTLILLNGRMLIGGNVTTQQDVYVGTTAGDGDAKFDLHGGIKTGDRILSIGLKQ
jgi:hypothetical protein